VIEFFFAEISLRNERVMKKISSLFMSLEFLLGLQSKDESLSDVIEIIIPIKNGELRADYYRPERRSKGTILTINGLAPLGNRDPRFILVNKSLVKLGYTVISPYYDEICNFKISLRNIEDIKESILYISEKPIFAPTGKISLFAPSFSGSLSLIAASDPIISEKINSICTIGAFGNVETVINNLFSKQELDEYGRMILLLNFLPISIGKNEPLFKALSLAILDNYYKNKDNLLAPHYAKMKKSDQLLFDNLKNDASFRMDHWKQVVKKGGKNRILLTALSVIKHIDSLKLPILLVHGAGDDVVPPGESSLLFEELLKRGVKSELCITNLISHGDTGFSFKTLLEVPKILSAFSFFFSHALDKKMKTSVG